VRSVAALHRSDARAGRPSGIVGQEEILAQWEALIVGGHVDPAEVAVAFERDPEHVVGLTLHPLGPLPHEGDRRHARIVARQAVGDDAQPVRRGVAPEVVDDLHGRTRVDAGQIAQELKAELGFVVQPGDDRDDVTGRDAHLGLVVALSDGPGQLRGEAGLEARLEMAIHA